MKQISKKYIFPLCMVAASLSMFAEQPYGGCWHPEGIRNWTKESDPNYKLNRSRVPLKSRINRDGAMRANDSQGLDGEITNATILYPRCSAAPSQGDYTFTGYQPTYWQYMDKLVYWAGSAGEGIIIPPPGPSIDAAHQEGVKVLGQVFFPPTYYGGKVEWVREMLTKEGEHYPYAQKLFEIARDLGFDGWFINEETGGGSNDDWVGFISDFNNTAASEGYDGMEIQWYNASRSPNIPILTTNKNTSQFLEYGAISDYRSYGSKLNCTEQETFTKLYAGVECAQGGFMGTLSALNGAFPVSGEHECSLALFCPEEHTWKDFVRDVLDKEDTGEKAYKAVENVFKTEEKFWVNEYGDPSVDPGRWRGVSGAIIERSAITELPFCSDMSVGVGKHRFVNGEMAGSQDWHHSGMQSVLPTWRWWIETRGDLQVTVNWDDAYNIGSSFVISGSLSAGDHYMRLYKTEISLPEDAEIKVIYKGDEPELILSTDGTTTPLATFNGAPSKTTSLTGGWSESSWSLKSLSGEKLTMVGLNLKASEEKPSYSFTLGRVEICDNSQVLSAPTIKNAKSIANLGQEKGDVVLTWDYEPMPGFDHFDIFMNYGTGEELVGQTKGEGFYIPTVLRTPGFDKVVLRIEPVMKTGEVGNAANVEDSFPALEKPEVSFKLSKSYIKKGETCELTAKASNFAETVKWEVPAELEMTSTSNPFVIRIKGLEEGCHEVKAVVGNAAGETVYAKSAVDVLNDIDYRRVGNVMLGKKIHSHSGSANEWEIPENLVDGVTNPTSVSKKWCSLNTESEVVFDCIDPTRFYGVKIYDCKAGPEDAENFHSYTLEVSDDLVNWEKVISEENLQGLDIKEDYVPPFEGRYIRFRPKVSGVLRVWEFEGIGLRDISGLAPAFSDVKEISGIYTLDGLRVEQPENGVYIVKYTDGTAKKLIR